LILEVATENERAVIDEYDKEGIVCQAIGRSNSRDVPKRASFFLFLSWMVRFFSKLLYGIM
jgi:hypothetical protein